MGMTIAAMYARVSSERQKDEQTIASQIAALKEYAAASGIEVAEEWVFQDEGFSGATLVRPALERLRDLVVQVPVPLVLCYSPDRLARKYAYQALLIEEFHRAGTEVRFLRGARGNTPEDELLLQFQGMIAEYERAQIAERTRRGKAFRARAGSVNVLSGAPYGYRYVRKSDGAEARYEIVEEHAAIVREIFRVYVEPGASIGSTARHLAERAVPTATGKSTWDRRAIWGVLSNPAYHGRAAFSKTMQLDEFSRLTRRSRLRGRATPIRPSRRQRPRDQWIELPVPAIVSDAVYELAARKLEENKRFAARRTKEPSLVQGLLICRSCGYAYYRASGRTTRRKLYYYRCTGSDAYRWPTGRKCTNPPVRQDYLDAVVWQQVSGILADPQLVSQELQRRLEEMRVGDPAKAHAAGLERHRARVRAAMDRLLVAYQEGLLSLDELRLRMPDLRKKEATIQAELNTLEAQQVDREACLKLVTNLEGFLARLREATENSSVVARQRVVRLLVKEVLIDRERVVIRHRIPTGSSGGGPGYLLRERSHDLWLRDHRDELSAPATSTTLQHVCLENPEHKLRPGQPTLAQLPALHRRLSPTPIARHRRWPRDHLHRRHPFTPAVPHHLCSPPRVCPEHSEVGDGVQLRRGAGV